MNEPKRKTVAEQWLEDILAGADAERLATFIREIKIATTKPAKKHDPYKDHGPIKTYTTVVKQYTCLLCGATFKTYHKLSKGEQMSTISPTGEVHTVTVSGKEGEVELPCTVSRCEFCNKLVSHWSREELERAFLTLAACCTFKEKVCYSKAVKEEREMGSLRFPEKERRRVEDDGT